MTAEVKAIRTVLEAHIAECHTCERAWYWGYGKKCPVGAPTFAALRTVAQQERLDKLVQKKA